MKRTILVCDCCRLPEPAVKSVDLCQKHLEVIQSWKAPKKSKPTKRRRTKHPHDAIEARVMQFAEERPMFTAAEVARDMNRPRFVVQDTVRKLIKAGKIASVSKGAGRKLSKAA